MLEENPYWITSPSEIEEKKKEIFDSLLFRNVTNKTMINDYCSKQEKKNKRRSARSLSLKDPKKGSLKTDSDYPDRTKIQSMKEVEG